MTRKLQVLDTSNTRSCGECNLCCTVQGVEEIQKPINVRCSNLNVLGRCGCYATRPQSCRSYMCLWRQGFMPDVLKPSRSRAVMEHNDKGDMIVMRVLAQDRAHIRRGVLRRFIESAASQNVPVIVVCGDERTLFNAREQDVQVIAQSIGKHGELVVEEVTYTHEVMR